MSDADCTTGREPRSVAATIDWQWTQGLPKTEHQKMAATDIYR